MRPTVHCCATMLNDRAEVRCPRDVTDEWRRAIVPAAVTHRVINRSNEPTEWTHKLPGRTAIGVALFHSLHSYGHYYDMSIMPTVTFL